MWIFFNDGFVSAVQHEEKPDELLVRARRPEILRSLFPDAELVVSGSTDYKYRVFVSRAAFGEVVAKKIAALDYPNFKASIEDHDLHGLAHRVWALAYDYQR